jgi:hypothetical protein
LYQYNIFFFAEAHIYVVTRIQYDIHQTIDESFSYKETALYEVRKNEEGTLKIVLSTGRGESFMLEVCTPWVRSKLFKK